MDNKQCDIVIIDTGVSSVVKEKYKNIVGKIDIKISDEVVVYGSSVEDTNGHGTSIYSIIAKSCPTAKIFIIKLQTISRAGEVEIKPELLISALEYVYKNIKCRFVNISMGIKSFELKNELSELCNKLEGKGIVIFSAYANDGTMSIPAAFDNVIGVTSGRYCYNKKDIYVVKNSPINVLALGRKQRVEWLGGKVGIVSGNSFACAYVTAKAFEICVANQKISFKDVMIGLEGIAKGVYVYNKIEDGGKSWDIRTAAIFPLNKEMHSVIRFAEELNFKVIDIYDVRYSGNVGREVSKIVPKTYNYLKDYKVKNISDIDFASIDTLILGHVQELIMLLDNKEFVEEIIRRALENGVRVYSFDDLGRVLNKK